ncbi:piggyBac transposable element-derived protein 3-like [Bactrocera dorsalis]|uniref:PiggyBac transposable element-derived protein 3-like n=1 Tax=Bactrocera dorsalis TaxID=27457 RepID=A0ABM3JX76_BACDO|nr:piggyBac transposable element-derived protein 3-like [Bactrocera dorsalis]
MTKNANFDRNNRRLNTQEVIDYLNDFCDSDEEDSPAALYILPPDNENGAISGEDDGDEDDVGKPEDICVGQLKAPCELVMSSGKRVLTIDNDDEEDDLEVADSVLIDILENSTQNLQTNLLEEQGEMSIEPSSSQPETYVSGLRKVKPTPSSVPPPLLRKESHFTWVEDNSDGLIPIFPSRNFEDCKVKPHEQLEKFFDDELIEHIINESRRYAIFLGKPNPQITSAELKVFIAILLVSGYNGRSTFKSFWSVDNDMRNEMVYLAMRRNRFEEILRFLHFEDSCKKITDGDKMWKLRSLTDHLKSNMLKHFHPEQQLSFDESMISYFGRHGCKQFIKGKPLRFGYKVWSLCTISGYLVNFEIYQGNNPRANSTYEQTFGKCAAPLLNMIDDFTPAVQNLPFSFYFDNLFTSVPLLVYLKARGYTATGTIRENRLPKSCPIEHKKILKNKERGHIESTKLKEANIFLTKWNDNAVVSIASTTYGANPVTNAVRYSQKQKKFIDVPRPLVIKEYNKYMSGVDRMDQNVESVVKIVLFHNLPA